MNPNRTAKGGACFLLLWLILWAGCATNANTWVGSVDAVFRYRPKDQSTVVYKIPPGSLSDQAGLKSGDHLLAVDGEDITSASFEEIRQALRGPIGSNVLLTIERGSKTVEMTIERKPIGDDTE